ncbi:STAS domain [Macleaya cordata]|uniref:STAS domain n=1 Tax=Macleaya cordata TaxID=56857 RepID=A0A200PNW5_MACCD|nr:STAS domain [Macleaya cordata]
MSASTEPSSVHHKVNFSNPRSFATSIKSGVKETFFPDDPFRQISNEPSSILRAKKAIQYFLPIFEWLPKYNFGLLRYDILAGVTIASLAIPQGISYAKLANLPPILGLYSSFVPPLIYAIFGSSKDLAIGTIASGSILLASIFGEAGLMEDNPTLYVHLIFTATFFTGLFQVALGFFRLGILVDFLSHSTIIGFMSGAAAIICLQQLKGMLGLIHFTSRTDVVSVMRSIFSQTHEWRWEPAVVGIIFLCFLEFTRYLKRKKQSLFMVSAVGPMVTVVVGCIFAYLAHAEKHGIQIVGHLNKGINPPSIKYLNFDPKYLPVTVKAGIMTGILALTEGIAIGRSFATMKNDQIDGNKEMIAFGTMNIVGSFTSCYLTTGPFSKTAVNYNAGCKTAMSNVVMSLCMMLTLLFLAPLFSYTPLVALSAILMSSMFGLIKYEEAYRLFKVDKFDFCICMTAFVGIIFFSMDVGLMLSVGLSIIRALLNVARPPIINLGNLSDSTMYRDVEQYPLANRVPGVLILQLGSPIYFANCTYVRERISRWIEDEQSISNSKAGDIEHVILDMGGVTSIDTTGIEMLLEVRKNIERKGIKVSLTNPKIEVMEKLMLSNFVETIGRDSVFLSINDAVEACRFTLRS